MVGMHSNICSIMPEKTDSENDKFSNKKTFKVKPIKYIKKMKK